MSEPGCTPYWITLPQCRYPVYVGSGCRNQFSSLCLEVGLKNKLLIVTHSELIAYAEAMAKSLTQVGFSSHILTIPTGEKSKNLETISHILDTLLAKKFERQDTVVALGGGIVGDVAGFAASIYLRGINLIQVPTSLLAQVDAAIGGKTGVNHVLGKNLIGSFYHPKFVLIDPDYLATLAKREVLCGLAEIIKYGVIQDSPLFAFIETHQEVIKSLTPHHHLEIWDHLIQRSVANKTFVVAEDPQEASLRKILNFGHTIGHAIETVFSYQYLHGEAVAIGMVAAGLLAVEKGLFSQTAFDRLHHLLKNIGFKLHIQSIDTAPLEEAMSLDKKVKNGKIQFVLPTEIGKAIIQPDVDMTGVRSILKRLMI